MYQFQSCSKALSLYVSKENWPIQKTIIIRPTAGPRNEHQTWLQHTRFCGLSFILRIINENKYWINTGYRNRDLYWRASVLTFYFYEDFPLCQGVKYVYWIRYYDNVKVTIAMQTVLHYQNITNKKFTHNSALDK